jgi:hypothetical protein
VSSQIETGFRNALFYIANFRLPIADFIVWIGTVRPAGNARSRNNRLLRQYFKSAIDFYITSCRLPIADFVVGISTVRPAGNNRSLRQYFKWEIGNRQLEII